MVSARIPTLLACAAFIVPAHAAIYTVGAPGTAGSCTHGTVQLAVNAAAANAGPDEIRISSAQTYTAQAIVVQDQELEITGGFADCFPLAPVGRTTLSGTGGAAAAVIRTQGNVTLTLRGLELRDGDSSGYGGGLLHGAAGRVTVLDTLIRHNTAMYGGGIAVFGPAVATRELVIGAGVEIGGIQAFQGNVANYGGGIHVDGGSLLIAGLGTGVRGNSAISGGGISVFEDQNPSSAEIGSGGNDADGVIARNSASSYGGGVYASGSASVRLYTTDAARPVRLNHNFAQYGGALMANSGASIAMWEGLIDHNEAQHSGAAVTLYEGGSAALRRDLTLGNPPAAAVACAAGLRCNVIADNLATAGAAVGQLSSSFDNGNTALELESATLRGNTGGVLFSNFCSMPPGQCGQSVTLRGCEISASVVSALVSLGGQVPVSLDMCTVAGNPDVVGTLFAGPMALRLERSIIWEPGRDLLDLSGGGSLISDHLLVSDASDFPAGPTIRAVAPRFVDPAAADFRLQGASPALDSAPSANAPSSSLDRLARIVDLPEAPNYLGGVVDLGGYERAPNADRIFRNGFEPK